MVYVVFPLSMRWQSIPSVTSVPVYSTVLPLVGVLTVTGVKDAYDDIVRKIG